MSIFRKFAGAVRAIRLHVRMASYNDWSIAEHFRSQGAQIGRDCRLLIRTLGSEPYLISIGNHCTLSSGVTLLTHDGAASLFSHEIPSVQKFGAISIFDNCFIGASAIILPGVQIGPNSVVGAGSIVTKDVPAQTIVAGNPARRICSLEEYRKKIIANWAIQRPNGYMKELEDGHPYTSQVIHEHKHASAALLKEHLMRTLMRPSAN
jgi:acetyltransferase-like isoleucine patch superfamily enzyme